MAAKTLWAPPRSTDPEELRRSLEELARVVNGTAETAEAGGGPSATPFVADTPTVPTGLTATGGFGCIVLGWDTATYTGHAYTEVWHSPNADFSAATPVGNSAANVFTHVFENPDASPHYYKVRHVNQNGEAGDLNAVAVSAACAQDVQYALDVLFAQTAYPPRIVDPLPTLPDADYPVGCLVVYTGDGKLYRNVANAWTSAVAWADVTGAPSVTQTFFQASEPVAGMAEGDFWLDSDDGNKAYRYDGAAWQDVQDSAIAQAVSDAATAQATADGKVKTFFQTTAPTAAGVGDLWFDTDDSNAPYRWNGSAWEAAANDVATWSKISGAGKPADGADVTADNTAAGITGQGALATLDQVTAGVIAAGAVVADAIGANEVITQTANIGNGVITSAKIGTAEVKTANIDDASITNAKIDRASANKLVVVQADIQAAAVDTLQLAGQAVTIPVSAYTAGATTLDDTWRTMQSAAITSTGAPIVVSGGAHASASAQYRLYRGASLIYDGSLASGYTAGPVTVTTQDTPGAGSVTYYLQARSAPGSYAAYNRTLVLLETKR